jgi:signal recognition particle subunit SRP54
MKMIPGMNKLAQYIDIDDKAFVRIEAIIHSMTPEERENPDLLNTSRKRRIATGCGKEIHEVNMFIKQFEEMRKMMHKLSTGKGIPGAGMMGGGLPAGTARRKSKRR